MALQEIIHKLTHEIRDSLEHDNKKYTELCAKYKAYEDVVKKRNTEIMKIKNTENTLKKDIADNKEKIEKVKLHLEEIDRQRSELNNRLKQSLTEDEALTGKLVDVQKATVKLQAQSKEEAQLHQNTKSELEKFEKEKKRVEELLKKRRGEAFDNYLDTLDKKIEKILLAQEEQLRKKAILDALKIARQKDPEIKELFDQREQFLDFIKKATVSGVKKSMQASLKAVEEKLGERFPGALTIPDSISPKPDLVEELLYYWDNNGKISIILPISESIWNKIENGDVNKNTTRAMFFIWNMVKNINLGAKDGKFSFNGRYCIFEAAQNIGKNLVSGGFNILIPKSSAVIKFTFSPLPVEIKGAIAYEISNI